MQTQSVKRWLRSPPLGWGLPSGIINLFVVFFVVAVLLAGCSAPTSSYHRTSGTSPYEPTAPPGTSAYAIQRVFYGTDRSVDASHDISYGTGRGESTFGVADVSIPHDHKFGTVDRPPSILGIEIEPATPTKHMTILSLRRESLEDLRNATSDISKRSSAHEGLLFIHGFNVTFGAAILRTAQLAHDLRIDGPSFAYDWPSAGKADPVSYRHDQQNAEWAAPDLARFLDFVSNSAGVRKLHIVAHSMGNYALALALEDLASRGKLNHIHDIAMAAPDIDASVFTRQYAAFFRQNAGAVTIYSSRRDKAMLASEKINGFDRLGDAHQIVILPGFDTVDATAVDTDFLGHGYFASSGAMMTDLVGLFQGRPMPRYPLEALRQNGRRYYAWPPGYHS